MAATLDPEDLILNFDPAAPSTRFRDAGIEAAFATPESLLPSPIAWPRGTRPLPESLTPAPVETRTLSPFRGYEDDIYGDIFFEQRRPTPFSALDPAADVIYCSSFSKTVAPGYRTGWIAPGRHMQRVLERKMAFTLSGLPLPQSALAEYLASGGYDRHLRRIRAIFRDNIERMSQAVGCFFPQGTRVSRPSGGFVLWVQLPRQIDTRELFGPALERGICFAPGDVFSSTKRYGHCMRLSCASPWSTGVERALETLGQLAGRRI